jgi:hypothetical protein
MSEDLQAELARIEQLPLEQRADAYTKVYDELKTRLERVDAQGPSA